MTQNWHVKLGAEQTHIPKRPCNDLPAPSPCSDVLPKWSTEIPAPHPCPAPGSKHEQDSSSCPSCLSSGPSTPGGRCHGMVQGGAPLLSLLPQDPIPALSPTFHAQLFAKHSPVLHHQQGDHGTTLRVSREEKQTRETPQRKQSFRAVRCGGGRCAPSPLGIIPGADPKPSFPQ